jgi:hypothetical protein
MKPRSATTETSPVPSSQPVPRRRSGHLTKAPTVASETPSGGPIRRKAAMPIVADIAPPTGTQVPPTRARAAAPHDRPRDSLTMAKNTRPTERSNTLDNRLKPGQTPAAGSAEMLVGGLAANAITAVRFSRELGELDLTECVAALVTLTQRVKDGDLGDAESLLTAQAVALNTIFTELTRRSLVNMGDYLDAAERYMRLALKAQSQCRATIETLALMKNPPTVFAKQANIAHGPQQVNNGLVLPSRAEKTISEPIELLEAAHGERMDFRTAGTAGACDQELAPVGTVHGPPQRRRKSTVVSKR